MKRVFPIFLVLILCTGCMHVTNDRNYDSLIDAIVNKTDTKANTTSLGYKYYLPMGVSKVYDKDYNQKLKIESTYAYMYVDAVSYYYRNSLNFSEEEDSSYYYYEINNAEKIGYVKITEEAKNKYFIKIIYNYAKIESYCAKSEIKDVLANSMIILKSIDYNDNMIKKILEDEYFSSVDKKYKIKKPDNTESKFSEYLSEYVQDEESPVPDLPEY